VCLFLGLLNYTNWRTTLHIVWLLKYMTKDVERQTEGTTPDFAKVEWETPQSTIYRPWQIRIPDNYHIKSRPCSWQRPNYRTQGSLPSFFLLLVRLSLRVCGSGHAGNTTLRRTTSNTVFPLSRNTCTAVAYSTFSSDTPLALIIRSFTLQTHATLFNGLNCEDAGHIE